MGIAQEASRFEKSNVYHYCCVSNCEAGFLGLFALICGSFFIAVIFYSSFRSDSGGMLRRKTQPRDNGAIHGKKIELFLNCVFKDSCDGS